MVHGKPSFGKVRSAVAAAIALALIAWGGAARAACTNCSLDGGAGPSNGSNETGQGFAAFGSGTDTGDMNSAFGYNALISNTTGIENTATGAVALYFNTTGQDNTATGNGALAKNVSGNENTATGADTLFFNTSGFNTANGASALGSNTTGSRNTAVGAGALVENTSGKNNIAIGYNAGEELTTGDYNIEIGNGGLAGDTNAIRIGQQGQQTETYMAGINGVPVAGAGVVVASNGQLGVTVSSERFERNIRNMGNASNGLLRLRPVTFRYRKDPKDITHYGLVAEEVARVYPELVTRDADGKVVTVRYLELTSMLLNELQKQARELRRQKRKDRWQAERMSSQDQQIQRQARLIKALSTQLAATQHQLGTLQTDVAYRLSALEHSVAQRDRARTLRTALSR